MTGADALWSALKTGALMSDNPASRAPARILTPAAERALAEAAVRRTELDAQAQKLAEQKEIKGRGGPDPVRYGDWEAKGLASDF